MAVTNYTATRPFTDFRFWGKELVGSKLDATEEFEVIIWDGDPLYKANIGFREILNGATTNTGESFLGFAIYQIDIDLQGTINQLFGYSEITRKHSTCDDGFAWSGDNFGNGDVLYSL